MGKHKPRVITQEEHERRSNARKRVWASEVGDKLREDMSKLKKGNHYSKGHKVTTEHRKKLSETMCERIHNSIWVNNGTINKRVLIDEPIPEGFVVGRIHYRVRRETQ